MYSCKTCESGVKNTENLSKIESTQQHYGGPQGQYKYIYCNTNIYVQTDLILF